MSTRNQIPNETIELLSIATRSETFNRDIIVKLCSDIEQGITNPEKDICSSKLQ